VLAAMKRGYSVLEFKSLVQQAACGAPRSGADSSDFILGFPGETEEDFEKTMKLIDELELDGSFSFVYSARVRARPASDMPDPVPQETQNALAGAPAKNASTSTYQVRSAQPWSARVQRVLVEGARARRMPIKS
jgi:tRNA-2-methylthio-N6-dimethylallyladenosine synthase